MSTEIYDDVCKLLEGEGKKAYEYCFDEAWFSDFFHRLTVIQNEKAGWEKSILIACAAIEVDASYGSSEGYLQDETYKKLLTEADTQDRYCELLESEDRMTNFYYVLKILLAILCPKEYRSGVDQSKNFGLSGPREFDRPYCIYLGEKIIEELEAIAIADKDKKVLRNFARNASSFGNYSRIPKEMEEWSGYLNPGKGNGLMVGEFCVNDQFAIFAEWIDKNMTTSEEGLVQDWKKAMLLDDVWSTYKDAAKAYKTIWDIEGYDTDDLAGIRKHRIKALISYLKLVNEAIERRSDLICQKLQSK